MEQRFPGAVRVDADAGAARVEYVGKYRILGELGRGAMGVVYRALDEGLGREVALKSPLQGDASEPDRRLFLNEARAASRVSHPHVVSVYEVFEVGDRPWLAMELVEGRTLDAAISALGRLPAEEILPLGEQIAEALDAAHARGLLHRDVKPGNIMLASRGDARLMDFGLARFAQPPPATAATTATTLDRGIAGTLGYISPEQILGRPLEPSSDVFSLGAVLYESATGRRAFGGETSGDVFNATLHLSPPPLTDLVPDAPAELQRIIAKALAKRPDERYQSARELAADLRTLRRQLESRHHPQGAPIVRRKSWWPAAIAAATIAAVVAIGIVYARVRSDSIELGPPQQLTAGAGWEAEPAVAPDGALVAYASNESGNADIWLLDMHSGNTVRLTDDKAADRSPAWLPDGTGVAFMSERGGKPSIWRVSRLGGSATPMIADAEDPAISPDGLQIAFARRDAAGSYRIGVAPIANPDQARILTNDQNGLWDHRNPAWSPDGGTIVYHAARDLWAVAATGVGARRLTFEDAFEDEPAWSPDGRFLFFSSNREGTRALWRVPAAGGTAIRLTGGQGPERQPSIARDGSRLVYSTFVDDADVVLRDVRSGREQRFGGERRDQMPVFSPDHRSLALVSDRWVGRFDIWLQPLDANGPAGDARRLTDHPGTVSQPAYSPDGRWIAYHRVFNAQRDIWIVPVSGGAPVQITSDPAMEVEPDWSPNSQQIVYVSDKDGADHLWVAPVLDGRPAGPAHRLANGPAGVSGPAWSPDGSTIAFVGGDSNVWILSVDGRGAARKLTSGATALRVCWDRPTGMLWASGFWGTNVVSLRSINVTSGEIRLPAPPILLSGFLLSDFDVTADGRLIAFAREELRGHLWVQEIRPRRFRIGVS